MGGRDDEKKRRREDVGWRGEERGLPVTAKRRLCVYHPQDIFLSYTSLSFFAMLNRDISTALSLSVCLSL